MNTLCFVPDSSGIDSRFPETQVENNGDRNMEGWALFWTIEKTFIDIYSTWQTPLIQSDL